MKNYKAQTRSIMRWEKKQAWGNLKKGLAVGLILGAVGVAVIYFFLVWLMN